MLKILSSILRPSRGRVEFNGRVGSLLEVGAGFHPELTGRENMFLNAAILGLKHSEIVQKLDEIVAFSGVERHLDEPVKHYSSGMYMRLAFAVAAHIEPEILLLDEVLAVGDAEFQKKSIERIEQVSQHGQTVILVSHNIQTVLRLCRRALCLDQGRVVDIGSAADVTARYLEIGGANRGARRYGEDAYAPGDHVVRLRGMRVRSQEGETLGTVDIGQRVRHRDGIRSSGSRRHAVPFLTVHSERMAGVVGHGCVERFGTGGRVRRADTRKSPGFRRICFPRRAAGDSRGAFLPAHTESFRRARCGGVSRGRKRGGARGQYAGSIEGAVRPLLEWSVEHRNMKVLVCSVNAPWPPMSGVDLRGWQILNLLQGSAGRLACSRLRVSHSAAGFRGAPWVVTGSANQPSGSDKVGLSRPMRCRRMVIIDERSATCARN